MSVQCFIFDLDGTLTDPAEGITNSIRYALRKFDIDDPREADLLDCIGPPLFNSFRKHWNIPEDRLNDALKLYREYFTLRGMFENVPYPGIRNLLALLSGSGKSVYLATGKPEIYAREILRHFDLFRYFSDVVGNTLEETRSEKNQLIHAVMALQPDLSPESFVMIGDRSLDVLGAKQCGIRSVGVLYGYGSREELETAKPDHIADSVDTLEKILLSVS